MKRALLAALAVFALVPAAARADDEASVLAASALVGEPFVIRIRVEAPPGAAVDIDPGASSWGDVAVLQVLRHEVSPGAGGEIHTFDVEAAAFAPGQASFRPAVLVSGADSTEVRELPELRIAVPSVLAPGDPLELRPLPPPAAVGGGAPGWVQPAAAASALLALALIGAVGWRATARLRRHPPPLALPAPSPLPTVEELAAALDADPATGYRRLAAAVRAALSQRYHVPASALTASELRRRLEAAGERWVARLAAGLLEECDAVVYGGYEPAPERRRADLALAAELLRGAE